MADKLPILPTFDANTALAEYLNGPILIIGDKTTGCKTTLANELAKLPIYKDHIKEFVTGDLPALEKLFYERLHEYDYTNNKTNMVVVADEVYNTTTRYECPKRLFFQELRDRTKMESLMGFMYACRHYRTCVICTAQPCNLSFRKNETELVFDFIFVGYSAQHIRELYRIYSSEIEESENRGKPKYNYAAFKSLFMNVTAEPFSYLVMDLRNKRLFQYAI